MSDFLLNCFVLGDNEQRDTVFCQDSEDRQRRYPQEIDQGGKGPSPQSRRCLSLHNHVHDHDQDIASRF